RRVLRGRAWLVHTVGTHRHDDRSRSRHLEYAGNFREWEVLLLLPERDLQQHGQNRGRVCRRRSAAGDRSNKGVCAIRERDLQLAADDALRKANDKWGRRAYRL